MKLSVMAGAVAAALICSGGVNAGAIEDELEAIKARISQLERMVQDQNAVIQGQNKALAEKDRQIQDLVSNPRIREGNAGDGWFSKVEIGGVIEVEAGYNNPDTGDSSSDVVVATAELGIAAQINDWVAGEISLLYEEDDTDLEIDVATVTIADPEGPWFFVGGQQYVPFGTYETNLVSDPFTLDIGETRETALLAGIEKDGFIGGVYFFNGDIDEGGDSEIDSFGAFAGYSVENEDMAFAVNGGYISNIADSDTLQDTVTTTDLSDQIAGFTVDGMISSGPFVFIAEYTTAIDDFEDGELDFKGKGAEPSAFNIEAGYNFMLVGKDATVALAYQETDEAAALELPEERIAVALSVGIMENTTLSFEWAHDDDYSTADGGTGGSGGDTATAQLAVEF